MLGLSEGVDLKDAFYFDRLSIYKPIYTDRRTGMLSNFGSEHFKEKVGCTVEY